MPAKVAVRGGKTAVRAVEEDGRSRGRGRGEREEAGTEARERVDAEDEDEAVRRGLRARVDRSARCAGGVTACKRGRTTLLGSLRGALATVYGWLSSGRTLKKLTK